MLDQSVEQAIIRNKLRSCLPLANSHTGVSEWGECKRCILHLTRRRVAIRRTGRYGRGGRRLLFIGESPGGTEDSTGEPFTGSAGRILDQLFEYCDQSFDYWITNLVGCRTCDLRVKDKGIIEAEEEIHNINLHEVEHEIINYNRPPSQKETELCMPHLEEIVSSWKPSGIVYLGTVSRVFPTTLPNTILESMTSIAKKEFKVLPLRKQASTLRKFIQSLL